MLPSEEHLRRSVLEFIDSEYPRLLEGETIESALARLRESGFKSRAIYFYVVNAEGRLVGVVPTRRMLLNPPDTPVAQIMERRVVTVPSTATLEDACELFILHRLLAVPVVDEDKRMIGVVEATVYSDEMFRLADSSEENWSEELFQLIGFTLSEIRRGSALAIFQRRFVLLLSNLAGGLICAVLAGMFSELLNRAVALALFLPVVLALAESVSIQTLTLVLDRQQLGVFSGKRVFAFLRRELPTGILLGLAMGTLVGGFAAAWHGQSLLFPTIAAGITLGLLIATVIGTFVPMMFWLAQRDARPSAGPVVLALTDVAALTAYLLVGLLIIP
ncbi:CBS domain-containing protein [Thermopirellula anaerolimosa]